MFLVLMFVLSDDPVVKQLLVFVGIVRTDHVGGCRSSLINK